MGWSVTMGSTVPEQHRVGTALCQSSTVPVTQFCILNVFVQRRARMELCSTVLEQQCQHAGAAPCRSSPIPTPYPRRSPQPGSGAAVPAVAAHRSHPPSAVPAAAGGRDAAGAAGGSGCSSAGSSAAGRCALSSALVPPRSARARKALRWAPSHPHCLPPAPHPTWLSCRAAVMPGASALRMHSRVVRCWMSFCSTKLSPLSSGEDERRVRSELVLLWGSVGHGGSGLPRAHVASWSPADTLGSHPSHFQHRRG